jgi:hypothetical protein
MNTNASNIALVSTLAGARVGTFTGVVIRKKGAERGPKGSKVRYGDDLVHVTLVTGFRYGSLVERSADRLDAMTDNEINDLVALGQTGFVRVWKKSAKVGDLRAVCASMGLADTGSKADLVGRLDAVAPGGMVERPLTRADFTTARKALRADLQGSIDGTAVDVNEDVYEPLVVDGETVRGCRVYVGNPNGDDASAPGTVYLQGLKVGQTVLEAAANGPVPASKSKPESVAKRILRGRLPVGRYVSYALTPDSGFILRAGGAAAKAADKDGVKAATPARVSEVMVLLAA